MRSRGFWLVCLAAIVATGILSRIVHTGFVLFDKYLGDALYAAMVYVLLRLFAPTRRVAIPAMVVMIAIECFQLTTIPAQLMTSEHWVVRMCARLLGTHFAFADLVAYAVGIAGIFLVDRGEPDG